MGRFMIYALPIIKFEPKLNSLLSVRPILLSVLFTKSDFYCIQGMRIFPIHHTSHALPSNSCFPQQSVTFPSARYKGRIQTHCTLFIVHKLTHIHAWAMHAPVVTNDLFLPKLEVVRRMAFCAIRLSFHWPDKTVPAWMNFRWKFMDESPKPGGSEMLCCMH